MYKIVTLIVCLFCFASLEAAFTAKGRVGAFFPEDKRLREIYGNCTPCYEVELSKSMFRHLYRPLHIDIWGNFDYLSTKGTIEDCGTSDLTFYAFSLGPKGVYWFFRNLNVYAGVGASVARASITNYCDFTEKERKTVMGVVFKSGINFYLTRRIFLDAFFDYLYQPVRYDRRADLGGYKVGIGLGMSTRALSSYTSTRW